MVLEGIAMVYLQEPEHIAMIRGSVSSFVENEMPRHLAQKWDKENHFPRDVYEKLVSLGWMGLTVSEAYSAAWSANTLSADNGVSVGVQAAMAKLFVCDTARDIVLTCQQVLGAYGYVKDFDMERYVRDILVMPILGGSSAIQKNNICNLLKLPR